MRCQPSRRARPASRRNNSILMPDPDPFLTSDLLFRFFCEELFDFLAKESDGVGAADRDPLNGVIRSRFSQKKARCSLDPGGRSIVVVLLNFGAVPGIVEARVEACGIHIQPACILLEVLDLKCPLVLEEHVVHLPVFALLAGAVSGFGRFAGLGVDPVEGEVPEDVADLSRVNILSLQGRECLFEKPPAEGALVIGKFEQGDRRIFPPHDGVARDADLAVSPLGRLGGAARQQLPKEPEFSFDFLQVSFDALQVAFQRVNVGSGCWFALGEGYGWRELYAQSEHERLDESHEKQSGSLYHRGASVWVALLRSRGQAAASGRSQSPLGLGQTARAQPCGLLLPQSRCEEEDTTMAVSEPQGAGEHQKGQPGASVAPSAQVTLKTRRERYGPGAPHINTNFSILIG